MKNIEDMSEQDLEHYGKLIELAKKNSTKWEKLGCLSYRKIGKRTYIRYKSVNTCIDDDIKDGYHIKLEQLVFLERVISNSDLKINQICGIWFGNANEHIKNSWNFKVYIKPREHIVENAYIVSLCGPDVYLSEDIIPIAVNVGSLSNPDIFKNMQKAQNEIDLFREKFTDICTNPQKYYQKILEL